MRNLLKRAFAGAAILALVGIISLDARAQTQFQFPTAPWAGYAPTRVQCGQLYGANFNVTTDQAIPISVPSAAYLLDSIEIDELFPLQPLVSLSTAQGGFYTGAGKSGITVVANSQAYSTITTNLASTTGNAMTATLATAGLTTIFPGGSQPSPVTTLYFSLTTAQGAAATANIRVYCRALF